MIPKERKYLVILSNIVEASGNVYVNRDLAAELLADEHFLKWLELCRLPIDFLKVLANSSADVSAEALDSFVDELKNPEG